MVTKSPARGQFVRSNVTGRTPEVLHPGTPGYNWADRKIFVGGADGTPIVFSTPLDLYDPLLQYKERDVCFHQGEVYRADTTTGPGNFNPAHWTAYTTNLTTAQSAPPTTGLLTGGMLTQLDATTLSVAAGAGLVINSADPSSVIYQYIEWGGFNVTVSLGIGWAVITIDDNGQVGLRAALTPAERRAYITLGYLVSSATGIAEIIPVPVPTKQTTEAYRDEYQLRGGAYRVTGANVTAAGANLTLTLGAGQIFGAAAAFHTVPTNPNIIDYPGASPLQFHVTTRDTIEKYDQTELETGLWDDAEDTSGTPPAVPGGQFTIQYVFGAADCSFFTVQLGQKLYSTLNNAQLAVFDDWDAFIPMLKPMGSVIIAAIVVRSNATDLTDPTQASIIQAANGRGLPFPKPLVAGLGFDDTDLYKLDGSRALTGNMDAGGNVLANAIVGGDLF